MNIIKFGRAILILVLVLWIEGCGTDCPGTKVDDLNSSRVRELKSKVAKLPDGALTNLSRQLNLRLQTTNGLELTIKPQQVIVKFVSGTSQSKINQVLSVLDKAKQKYVFKANGAILVDLPSSVAATSKDIIGIVMALSELNSVEYATPNMMVKAIDIPTDPLYGEQDDLNPNSNRGPLINIHAQEAWSKTQGSKEVLVGIIDTGIDYNHPDLADNIWTNPGETGPWMPQDPNSTPCRDKSCNGIDDDGNGYVDDVHGYNFVSETNHDPKDDHYHGTHVAGTIGATANNQIGVAGINWHVSLVALKFLDSTGSGSVADAVRAVEYATKMKIPITNNSWGGGGFDPTLNAAIAAAGKQGSLFVAAAGNNSSNNDSTPSYPASYNLENVISVAAVDSTGELASFSNFGLSSVHLAAPGVNVLSTTPFSHDQRGYIRLSGTSMATPHVAGAAALLKALYPSANPLQLKSRLVYSATKLASLNGKVMSGGLLNIEAAMVDDQSPPNAVANLKRGMTGITRMSLQWSPSGDDGSSGLASFYLARLSSQPIQNENDWEAAKSVAMTVSNFSAFSDVPISGEIKSLPLSSKGFVTLRAVDNVGNLSPLSPSLAYQLATPSVLYENNKSNLETVTRSPQKNGWGVESDPKKGMVFSDSPNKPYEDNIDVSMILPPIQVLYPDAVIQFETKLSCEPGLDWANVEYQVNNEVDTETKEPKWRTLGAYSAMNCNWAPVSLQFGEQLVVNDIVTFRLHFTSDASGREDGWLVRGINILGVAPPKSPGNPVLAVLDSPSNPYLTWADLSTDETHFEIGILGNEKRGDITFTKFYDADMDSTYIEYPGSPTDPKSAKLRVRACNGDLCSPTSSAAVIRSMTTLQINQFFNSTTKDYIYSRAASISTRGYVRSAGFKVFNQNPPGGRDPVYSCTSPAGLHSLSNSGNCSPYWKRGELLGYVEKSTGFRSTPIYTCSKSGKSSFYTYNSNDCSGAGYTLEKGQLGYSIRPAP